MIIDKSRRQVYNPINQIGNYGYCDAGAERRLLRKINGVVKYGTDTPGRDRQV